MKDIFEKRKQDILSKNDKSHIGNVDKKIASLCEKINKSKNCYTTSSCSGRVVIMIDQQKKAENLFLLVYHDLINFIDLKKDLSKILSENKKNIIKFKQEPCILHVACKNFEDAEEILNCARISGWKKSGIISSGKRFIVEMNSTEKLEFPIIDKNILLVDDYFLKLIIKKANFNLKKSWEKIEKLEKLI